MKTLDRRGFLRSAGGGLCAAALSPTAHAQATRRPNILFCLSDDHTWLHCSAYGSKMVNTPHFDRVAREGILFNHAYVSVPSCNPSRATVLTGMHFWRLQEASMNHTPWVPDLTIYTDLLENAGYHVGYTGKGCMPTDWRAAGRTTNPAGHEFNRYFHAGEHHGMNATDYARNFEDFLAERPPGAPFCFWYGGNDPHRVLQEGIGLRTGKKLSDAEVPKFYPDTPEIRSDLLDYAVHIEWFDMHLGRMLDTLETRGELDNTLIVVAGDNGMAFPRAKATCYEYGAHIPLAVRWGNQAAPGRTVDDFVSFVDFAPTFLEAADLPVPGGVDGRSLLPILRSNRSGTIEGTRSHLVYGIERHFPGGREGGWGYPIRALREGDYLYIQNLAPERWPAGDPDGPVWPDDDPTGGFGDSDGSPTKTCLFAHREAQGYYYDLAFGKRPSEELFDVAKDPDNLHDLARNGHFARVKARMAEKLARELERTQDPRALGKGAQLDAYARMYQKSL